MFYFSTCIFIQRIYLLFCRCNWNFGSMDAHYLWTRWKSGQKEIVSPILSVSPIHHCIFVETFRNTDKKLFGKYPKQLFGDVMVYAVFVTVGNPHICN